MTTINLVTTDQLLGIVMKPKVASGDVESTRLHVDFDAPWDLYIARTAVFFTSHNDTVYEMTLVDGECTIPHEVLTKSGTLYIGVRGTNSNGAVKTSTLVKYKIEEGAPVADGTTKPPTPDVYQQLSAAWAVDHARINQFTALPEGSTTGDAELMDGRVDKDGVTHPNIGEHIRNVTGGLSGGKLDKNQGAENADKLLYVNEGGAVAHIGIGEDLTIEKSVSKNIVFGEWDSLRWETDGTLNNYDGVADKYVSNTGFKDKFPVEPNTKYTASCTELVTDATAVYAYVRQYDENGEFISGYNAFWNPCKDLSANFTTDVRAAYITFYVYGQGGSDGWKSYVLTNFMIEKGSVATEYEPHRDTVATLVVDKDRMLVKDQGAENADKLLYVNEDGMISPIALGNDISIEKITSKNLVFGEWQGGNFNVTDQGQWVTNDVDTSKSFGIKQKFPVVPGETYTASVTELTTAPTYITLYVSQYDENLAFIAPINYVLSHDREFYKSFTVSENTRYISIHFYFEGGNLWRDCVPTNFMIERGAEVTEYEPYHDPFAKLTVEKDDRIEEKFDKNQGIENRDKLLFIGEDGSISPITLGDGFEIGKKTYKNIVHGEWVAGRYHFNQDGRWEAYPYTDTTKSSNFGIVEKFPVVPNTTYTVSVTEKSQRSAVMYVGEFDENLAYISSQNYLFDPATELSDRFTVGENTRYISIYFYRTDTSVSWTEHLPKNFMIEKGSVATEYEPYGTIDVLQPNARDVYDKMAEENLLPERLTVPAYYHVNKYLDGKCTRIRELLDGCAGDGDAFFFVTDQHWELNARKSPVLMNYISEKVHIPRMFCGGDTADSIHEQYAQAMTAAFSGDTHYIMGNHDYFGTQNGNKLAYLFDFGKREQIGNTRRHYYYVNNDQQKIRYVVLNSFSNDMGSIITAYDVEQINWLRDTALDVEDGWTVIVFAHSIYYGFGENASFNPSPDGASTIIEVLDTATCDVACVITGHAHLDRIKHTPNGIPVVVTTCDKYSPWVSDGVDQEPWITRDRAHGTITEQAFDVCVLDKAQRKITFVRIGAPADNWIDGTSTGMVEERVVMY